MARTAAVGIQDFEKIIRNNCFYVDKTLFLKEWWENMDDVTLITRPRRFGKTLTMSMTEQFFSIKYAKNRSLFQNLKIWQHKSFQNLQGTYPVIFFSFSRVKGKTYESVREKIFQVLTDLYAEYSFLLNSSLITASEQQYFHQISDTMKETTATIALNRLSYFLYKYYNKKVILLLDEYDTPMHEAYSYGYWEEMSELIKNLLHAAFKDNPYMERGILTGITRISKESVFSDLNNLKVITTTSTKYETAFGFTQEEVTAALDEFGLTDRLQDVKRWYDGFRFGTQDNIYNPWSVINFLDEKKLKAYWANTSSNSLAGKLLHNSHSDTKLIMEDLLNGKSFFTTLDEEIIFKHLSRKKSAVWSLLLASGYLKVIQTRQNRMEQKEYELTLTNKEIRIVFDDIVKDWFSNNQVDFNDFSSALINGNIEFINDYINVIAEETFSSFDTGLKPSQFKQPENFYHGFVLGLIVDLRSIYKITSNRESGFGRYDVIMEPVDPAADDSIILEFKVHDTKNTRSLEETAQSACQQILDKKYASTLMAQGIPAGRIRIYGFAFQGKHIFVDGGYLEDLIERLQYRDKS